MNYKTLKPAELTKEQWGELYPKHTLAEIATLLGCGETTVYKWIRLAGITLTKQPRKERSPEHKQAISNALRNKTHDKSGSILTCPICKKTFYVIPARIGIAKYCSVACRAKAVQSTWTGANNPRYINNLQRSKTCEGCGAEMHHIPPKPITSFLLQKFCTKDCADQHGDRLSGVKHPHFKGNEARRRSRSTQHSRWASKVIQRDGYKCMRCGVSGEQATLQAHHIKPYELFPEQRNELNNGITLCSKCHWTVHDTLDPIYLDLPADKKVEKAKSKRGLFVQGSLYEGKVFGKDSKKWTGQCYWCGTFLVKRLSDVTNRTSTFCGKGCAMKHRRAFGKFRPSDKSLIPNTARPPEQLGLNKLEEKPKT